MKATHFLSSLALVSGVAAELKEFWHNITFVDDVNPTGEFSRRAFGVNGTFPPPPISVTQGDTVRVHAYNGLGDRPTTVHHHGMWFYNASQFDGASMLSQCPIPPGETFTYEIPMDDQPPGTYWWHSHFEGQYADGFRAPFIVHPKGEPAHEYDEDVTVVLADWYKKEYAEMMKSFLHIYNPTGAEPVPDTALIYFAQNDTYIPGFSDDAKLRFEPGKKYRLRLINMSALSMFHVWIDDHDMQIIEADGVDTEAHSVDKIDVAVAQRVSLLVTAKNSTDLNYYLHADFHPDMFDVIPEDLRLNYTSSIIYDDDADFYEPALLSDYDMFDDTLLVPIEAQALEPADTVYNLTITFETRTDGTNRGVFNDIPYNPPKVPSTLVALNMGDEADNPGVYGPVGNNLVLEYNKTVEVTLWNTDDGPHPFHLHGHTPMLARRQNMGDELVPIEEDQSNPMRRDTYTVDGLGSVTLRFKSMNPGAWFLHCHIAWHLSSGLALTMIEAPKLMQEWLEVPSYVKDQCDMFDKFQSTGNAAGHEGTNMKGLTTGPWPQWPTYGWTPKAIGALAGCIITAILGVLTVIWYSFGGDVTEAELISEVRAAAEAKAAAKKKPFGSLFQRSGENQG